MRIRLELMIGVNNLTEAEIEQLKQTVAYLTQVGLVAIDPRGIDDQPFLQGGFNPHRLLVKDADSDWREEPL